MIRASTSISKPVFGLVIAATGAVLAWRVVALVLLHRYPESVAGSSAIQALLGAAGVVFLVCGLLVLRNFPSRASLLFEGFCLCSGLHWGGPLQLAEGSLRATLLFLYLIVSGILATALLLHLTLVFPKRTRLAERKAVLRSLYAPAIVAFVVAAIFVLSPQESGLRSASQGTFLALHLLVSNLFAVLALAIYVSLLFRSRVTPRQKRYVGWMVGGMLVAWLPSLIASSLGAEADLWNLSVVALPIAFTFAFFGIDAMRDEEIPEPP